MLSTGILSYAVRGLALDPTNLYWAGQPAMSPGGCAAWQAPLMGGTAPQLGVGGSWGDVAVDTSVAYWSDGFNA
jgi:hypothetical protein